MSQQDLRDMLGELLGLDEGLGGWELGFIDSLSHWDGDFTEGQAAKLEQIYDKRLGSKCTHN